MPLLRGVLLLAAICFGPWLLYFLVTTARRGLPFVRHEATDWHALLKNSWFTFDRRTLGLTRILMSFYLICDLFRRGAEWEPMFGDKGILPSYVILSRPQSNGFSLLHGFTTPAELWVLFAVILAVYLMLLVGYRTKVMQIAALIIVTSMNGRVLLIENGGYVVQNLLLLWTAFLPLGDRFSLDGMLRSMRRKRERTAAELNDRSDLYEPRQLELFYSVVGGALALQIAAVYYFNVVHKTGPDWKVNWSAVHYVLYVDRMVTPIVAHTREFAPFWILKLMTPIVLGAEAAIAYCMLLPQLVIYGFDVKLWLKRSGLVMIEFLHIGFGNSFVLGPFAWALCIFSSLYFNYQDWEVSIRAMRRPHRERTVIFDPTSGFALWFCRVVARMDRFGLVGFDEARDVKERTLGLSVLRRDGTTVAGAAAVADVVAALPIGPVFAWMLRIPPLSLLVDWAVSDCERTSRFFGLSTAMPAPAPVPPLRTRMRRVGRVLSEAVCLFVFVSEFNQALGELWSTRKRWSETISEINTATGWKLEPQAEVMRLVPHKFRFLQGWFMFSPNPVKDDGVIVVDAVTVDGRHIDPFTGVEPNFDLLNAKSYGYNQIWSDYFNRIHMTGNRAYRDAMIEYMRRYYLRSGRPGDQLVSGEIYWVHDNNPPWPNPDKKTGKIDYAKSRRSFSQGKDLLFTFGPEGGAKEPKPGT